MKYIFYLLVLETERRESKCEIHILSVSFGNRNNLKGGYLI